jgi:hypothetical protein
MVSAAERAAWQRVAVCEEGGNWHVRGPVYSGGLGISDNNWTHYSAGLGFPVNAADATEDEQIIVAQRIEGSAYVPDQGRCCESW